MARSIIRSLALAAMWLVPAWALAGDLLVLDVQSSTSQVSVSGPHLIDLVDTLINSKDQFTQFQNQVFTSSLTYAGVPNAVQFTRNTNAGDSVTLAIPITGFTRTFSGTNEDDVQNQIEDFLKKDGATTVAQLLKAINERSPVAVTDGNPTATTAVLAGASFRRYGLNNALTLVPGQMSNETSGSFFNVNLAGSKINTDVGDGYSVDLEIVSGGRFNKNVALTLAVPINYRTVEGSAIYNIAGEIGLPITIVVPDDRQLGWTVTPFGAFGAGASVDLVAGGIIWGAGINSLLSYQIDGLVIGLSNQISFYEGLDVGYDQYEFDTDVSQQLLINGVKVAKYFDGGFFLDGSVSYSMFLKDAAIDHYWTPSIGLGTAFGRASGIRIAYAADLAEDYTAHRGSLNLYFTW